MNIPDLTEMRRWQIEPGDRLIVTFNDRDITPEQGQFIQQRVRAALALPADFPVLVISKDMTVEVAEDPRRNGEGSHRHLTTMPAEAGQQSAEWALRFYDGDIVPYDDEADARRHQRKYGGEVVTRQAGPWHRP